jgi:hypothetical protein
VVCPVVEVAEAPAAEAEAKDLPATTELMALMATHHSIFIHEQTH